MLIWGSGSDSLRVRAASSKPCPTCGLERPFSLYLLYDYAHLYYLFSWVTKRVYLVACDICQRGTVVPRSDVGALPEDPIPALRRSGWKIGAGLLGGLLALALISGLVLPRISANAQRAHVGDIYECQFDRRPGETADRYGLVRIQSVSDTAISLAASRTDYADRSQAHADFVAKRWTDPGYLDTGRPFTLTPAQLERLRQSGRVFAIWRED